MALKEYKWRAVYPSPGPSFTESKASFGELTLTEEKLRELDANEFRYQGKDSENT